MDQKLIRTNPNQRFSFFINEQPRNDGRPELLVASILGVVPAWQFQMNFAITAVDQESKQEVRVEYLDEKHLTLGEPGSLISMITDAIQAIPNHSFRMVPSNSQIVLPTIISNSEKLFLKSKCVVRIACNMRENADVQALLRIADIVSVSKTNLPEKSERRRFRESTSDKLRELVNGVAACSGMVLPFNSDRGVGVIVIDEQISKDAYICDCHSDFEIYAKTMLTRRINLDVPPSRGVEEFVSKVGEVESLSL